MKSLRSGEVWDLGLKQGGHVRCHVTTGGKLRSATPVHSYRCQGDCGEFLLNAMPQGNYAGYLPPYPVRSQCWNCPNPAVYLGLVCNLCLEPWSRQLEQSESLPKFRAFMDALAERNEDPSQITFIDRFPDGGEVRMKIEDVEGKPVEIAVEVTYNLEEDWHRAGESAQRKMRTMAPEKG